MDDEPTSASEGVTRVLRAGVADQPVEEGQFLADLKERLFGETTAPITLSRYVVLDRLAAGGAGVVYRAFDPELDRKVAIKLLNARPSSAGADSLARARLMREAQAMAKLSHPNVIAVHDVGTYDEEEIRALRYERRKGDEIPPRGVFIVMELVEGVNLAEWLGDRERGWREVLEAFIAAGQGLAAAHHNGLIHRDFKPANVLVGIDGRVRVLDFGLARALEGQAGGEAEPGVGGDGPIQPVSERGVLDSNLTQAGTIMGTPAYMAPEQHRGEARDEGVDQYAFSVALYEGLFGELPFAGKDLRQLERQKKEGPAAPAATRGTPAWVTRAILRGMAPEPGRRHPSMDALLQELSRALRPRWPWAVAAGVILLMGMALTYSLTRTREPALEACRDRASALAGVWDPAVRERVRVAFEGTGASFAGDAFGSVSGALDEYTARWTEFGTQVCGSGKGAGDLARQARQLTCLDRRLTRVEQLTLMFAGADQKVVEHAAEAVGALPPLEPCLGSGPAGPDAADPDSEHARSLAELDSELARAEVLRDGARFSEGIESASKVVARARTLGHASTEIRANLVLAGLQLGAGQAEVAERTLDAAHRRAAETGNEEQALSALVSMVEVVGLERARYDEGERLALMAESRLAYRGLGDALDARLALLLGRLRLAQGRYDDALAALEPARELAIAVHGPGHLRVADVANAEGNVLARQGKHAAALASYEQALEIREARLGARHPRVGNTLNNLGAVLRNLGKLDESLARYERAVEIQEAALGPEHPGTAVPLVGMAIVLQDLQRSDEALAANERALEIRTRTLAPDHPDIAQSHDNLGILLNQTGRHEDALGHQEPALAIRQRSLGATHPDVALTLNNLAYTLVALDRHEEALAHLQRALSIREGALDASHPDIVWSRANLGEQLARMGRTAEARTLLTRAVREGTPQLGEEHAAVARARMLLKEL